MKHFRGYLGNSYLISDFDYDENVFEIKNSDELFDVDFPVKHEKVLHYIGKDDNCVVDLPSGCYSTCGMFYWVFMRDGFKLGKFDTSHVDDMSYMYANSIIPDGFVLDLNTSSVVTMAGMFDCCAIGDGAKFGSKFDTSSVRDMKGMFYHAKLPAGFTLGSGFNTGNVLDMSSMFETCAILGGFSLGDNFDTREVRVMRSMFYRCNLPAGFTLGSKFTLDKVGDASRMFNHCMFNADFTTGDQFDVSRVLCKDNIFTDSGVGWMRSKGESEWKPLDTYLSYKDESGDLYDYKVGDIPECFKGMKTA